MTAHVMNEPAVFRRANDRRCLGLYERGEAGFRQPWLSWQRRRRIWRRGLPMTFATGSRLGPYEIRFALGAGGMGEVYRARDTTLNRDVAIKVLLPLVASDPERVARLGREAQILAALNHPNIASIY